MMNLKLYLQQFLFVLACGVLPSGVLAQTLKMTPEILWTLKRVSVQGLNADETKVIYTQKQYNLENQENSATHHSVEISSGKVQQIEADDRPVFQRNKNGWYAREDHNLIISKDAGKSWEKFDQIPPTAELIVVSPDGKWIAYTMPVHIENNLLKDKYRDLPLTTAQVYDDLNYRHWDTWEDGSYSHVWIKAVGNQTDKDLLAGLPYDVPQQPFGGGEDIVWSPDSKNLLYVCKKKFGKAYVQSTNTDIYAYNIETGKTENITDGMMGYDMQPTFSPDGKYLAFLSMEREGYEADKNNIILIPWINGSPSVKRINLTSRWDRSANDLLWNNDSRTLYCTAADEGTVQVFAASLPPMLDNVKAIPTVTSITKGKFDVTGLVAQVDKELIVTRTDHNHATELFAIDLNNRKMRQLSHANDEVYKMVKPSKSELRMVKTKDGKQMGVWVIYPPDFSPSKKYPTLLYCQGGPQSALTQFFSIRWNFALMAANGYIVVAPNRRGMPGWGSSWNEAISKDWGGGAMDDYLAAIDAVSQESYVDKSRLGCVGASYGGYSVYMLAGMHQNRFKSFISHCGLFDMRSWYGTTEEMWFANWDLGGPYWQKPEPVSYSKFNPSNYVQNWNTPILIIQGGKDYRVPIGQSQQAFQAAQLRGIKSRFLYFPDENHWVLKPQNGLAWQREFFNWLKETL